MSVCCCVKGRDIWSHFLVASITMWGKVPKILIVDDNEEMRELLEIMLQEEGHDVFNR